MNSVGRRLFHNLPLLSLVLVSLWSAFPTVSHAATATGGITTTMSLTYLVGVQKFVLRIDPPNVQAFHLDVQFLAGRVLWDQTFGLNGIQYIFPFTQTTPPDTSALGSGLLQDIAGAANPALTSPGDVDMFELQFFDLQPALPFSEVPFTVFASSNDFIVGYDPDTKQSVTFDHTQIAPLTMTVPEGNGTFVLLALALAGLEVSRRKLRTAHAG